MRKMLVITVIVRCMYGARCVVILAEMFQEKQR